MNKKLAIKGHSTRGMEVIKLLEMMGGNNRWNASGGLPNIYYFISNECIIYSSQIEKDVVIFTLEEFLEKYPFKVGDKVFLYDNITEGCVTGMEWDEDKGTVKYCVYTSSECWCDVKDLLKWNAIDLVEKHYQEQCEEINESQPKRDIDKAEFVIQHMILPNKVDDKLEYEIIDGYEFDKVENGKIILKPIKSKYPTNYQECCDVLGLPMQNALKYINKDCNKHDYYNDLQSTLNCFVSLKMCRDAYWKIAGEELGLDKPWKPDWDNLSTNHEFIKINKGCFIYSSRVLVFPTEEMRDAFYENFKELIESCKELL